MIFAHKPAWFVSANRYGGQIKGPQFFAELFELGCVTGIYDENEPKGIGLDHPAGPECFISGKYAAFAPVLNRYRKNFKMSVLRAIPPVHFNNLIDTADAKPLFKPQWNIKPCFFTAGSLE